MVELCVLSDWLSPEHPNIVEFKARRRASDFPSPATLSALACAAGVRAHARWFAGGGAGAAGAAEEGCAGAEEEDTRAWEALLSVCSSV
eukprot:3610796-Rhodomonas_salina.2